MAEKILRHRGSFVNRAAVFVTRRVLRRRWVCWLVSRSPWSTALALGICIRAGVDAGLILAKGYELAGEVRDAA